ncbi:MAG: sulfotransferase [Thermoflexales bacterium]|nr:sulfotransferase [Thermoflexales bacterium]
MTQPFAQNSPERVQVLYIAGAGRSGGTLLGKILGEFDDMLYVGELRETWTPILATERLCGCGQRVVECAFWQQVFKCAYGGLHRVDLDWMNAMRLAHTRTRHVMFALPTPERVRFSQQVGALYQALANVSGCHTIVDTSRVPGYAQLLQSISGLELRVVHLVRDPRAVAYSWQRMRTISLASRTAVGQKKSPLRSAVEWAVQNWLVEQRWSRYPARYFRLRYEDLIASPRDALHCLFRWLGSSAGEMPFIGEGWIELSLAHSIAGNQYRLITGRVPVVQDEEWRQHESVVRSKIIWFLRPLASRYGYII